MSGKNVETMSLREYVQNAISSIIDSVDQCSAKYDGKNGKKSHNIYFTSYRNEDRVIEFDIATIVDKSIGGGATIQVADIGMRFGGKRSEQNISRIRFGINIDVRKKKS